MSFATYSFVCYAVLNTFYESVKMSPSSKKLLYMTNLGLIESRHMFKC